MKKTVSILRKAGLVFLAMVALTFLLILLSRLTTPSSEQRAAVELMQRDELPNGPDAFGLLWTLDRDVPFDEIDAVVRADAAQIAAWPDVLEPGEAPSNDTAWRRDEYPDLSLSREDRALFCGTHGESTCLEQVRAAPEATAQAVERNARLLERIRGLRDAEVLRYAFPPNLMAPMPNFQDGILPMTAHALAFVQGNEDEAMAETCRDLATWRRLALNTELIIGAMVGVSYAGRGYGQLLAEMLSEWPADRPLPPACDAALAPVADEDLRLCDTARGEFRFQERLYEQSAVIMEGDSMMSGMQAKLFFDPESTVALAAEQIAPYCTAERPGRPDHDWADSRSEILLRWVCVGNPIGCILTGIAHGNVYGDYADRMLDFDARLRQLRTLAWMREQAVDGARADALIERLPPELQDVDQPIEVAPDGRGLRVRLIDTRRGDWAEIPLPPALFSGAAATEPPSVGEHRTR